MAQAPTSEEKVLEALAKVPMFSQLDDRDRRKLAKLCAVKSFEAGDVLYEEGAMGLSLFIVTSGRVEIYRQAGKRKVGLGTVSTGGVLGQLALIDDQPRADSAAALERTDCLLLTRDSFDTLVKKEPAIAWCLAPALAGRIRDLEGQAVEAAIAHAEAPPKAPPAAEEEPASKARSKPAAAEEASDDEEDEDETSDIESAFFKMMRMQFGMMAGAAKCMTETSKVMETFLDSIAEETELKTSEDWGDMMGKLPDAWVTATREAMDQCEEMPQEMVDAYRKYSDEE